TAPGANCASAPSMHACSVPPWTTRVTTIDRRTPASILAVAVPRRQGVAERRERLPGGFRWRVVRTRRVDGRLKPLHPVQVPRAVREDLHGRDPDDEHRAGE